MASYNLIFRNEHKITVNSIFVGVLAQDSEKLQFCADVRWAERDNGAVWALSTRFHKYFKRSVSKHEINVRVLRVVEAGYGGGYIPIQPHVLRRAANFTSHL